jgi:hypothetical protein
MDYSPLGGRFVLNPMGPSMAKSAPELKCRFASNSMPQSYGRGEEPGR